MKLNYVFGFLVAFTSLQLLTKILGVFCISTLKNKDNQITCSIKYTRSRTVFDEQHLILGLRVYTCDRETIGFVRVL